MITTSLFADGLRYPQSPVWTTSGLVLVLESARGTVSCLMPDGAVEVVADVGGAPSGAAIGPDGCLYVCNNGGVSWSEVDGVAIPGGQADSYTGGKIQRVDLETGTVELLYDEVDGIRLRGPHDLVFDSTGGFWVTDPGKVRLRERDRGGLYYAKADGSSIRSVVFPLDAPAGVALSPEEDVLYVADSQQGRIYQWALSAPGEIAGYFGLNHRGTLLVDPEGGPIFGSMAIDRLGNLCVATMRTGGVTVVTADGVHRLEPFGDPLVTSLGFGGPNRSALYATHGNGQVTVCEWEIPGANPVFESDWSKDFQR